jgi:site-specific DNA-methyltransferase (adenine-specific)
MPDDMAKDLITSWSRPGDLVFDSMMGSATTCKMALLNHRHYLGFEIHEPYFQLAQQRMRDAHAKYRDDLDSWLIGA